MPRKRLLLLANVTGYQTRVFAETGARLGLDVVLATDRCHKLDDPWGDQAIPVRFQHPEHYAAKLAATAEVDGRFHGIVAVGDLPTHLAAVTAARLGIPYNSPGAVQASRNKYLARERFRLAGLPVPRYFRVRVTEDPSAVATKASFPCVLKPLGLSASRGVIRANDEEEFVLAFERIRALLDLPDIRRLREEQDRYIQIEDFIPGREYALEGVVTAGCLHVFALFDKPDPLNGPFFEETIYVTPSREPDAVQRELIETAARAVAALGLTQGPIHAEMRLNAQGVWMLEVAARPIGGLCAKALRFEPDTPLEELIVRHALGEDVTGARLLGPAAGVMMIPIPREGIYNRVRGVERASAVPGIEEAMITAKEGQKLAPLPEGSSYLGFLFARSRTPDTVEAALRRAHAELEFDISGVLPVMRAG